MAISWIKKLLWRSKEPIAVSDNTMENILSPKYGDFSAITRLAIQCAPLIVIKVEMPCNLVNGDVFTLTSRALRLTQQPLTVSDSDIIDLVADGIKSQHKSGVVYIMGIYKTGSIIKYRYYVADDIAKLQKEIEEFEGE